ncbi:hypothetical protein ACFL4H_00280 [Candidatus Neomarinimicrobiota bacterium]
MKLKDLSVGESFTIPTLKHVVSGKLLSITASSAYVRLIEKDYGGERHQNTLHVSRETIIERKK